MIDRSFKIWCNWSLFEGWFRNLGDCSFCARSALLSSRTTSLLEGLRDPSLVDLRRCQKKMNFWQVREKGHLVEGMEVYWWREEKEVWPDLYGFAWLRRISQSFFDKNNEMRWIKKRSWPELNRWPQDLQSRALPLSYNSITAPKAAFALKNQDNFEDKMSN